MPSGQPYGGGQRGHPHHRPHPNPGTQPPLSRRRCLATLAYAKARHPAVRRDFINIAAGAAEATLRPTRLRALAVAPAGPWTSSRMENRS